MKNSYLLLLALSTLFCFQSCQKNDLQPQPEWVEYCEDVSGGEFDIKINGQNWKSACIDATYTKNETDGYSSKVLQLHAYNYGATFHTNSEIEFFYIVYSEATYEGETESGTAALFIDDFTFNVQTSEEFDGKAFATDESETDQLNITQLTSELAKGSFNLKLFNQNDSNDQITVNGNFSAVIEQ